MAIKFVMVMTIFSLSFSLQAQNKDNGKKLFETCVQCHGAAGEGNSEQLAPRISGQYDWYILTQLNNFKSGARKNEKMMPYINNLKESDFKDLAAYISTL